MTILDAHPKLALVIAIWAAVGPLAGIVVGHVLTRSWQRKQWLLDCRKEEFKELLSAIQAEALAHLAFFTSETANPKRHLVLLEEIDRAHRAAEQVIMDRLYISKDMHELKVRSRFREAMDTARKNNTLEPVFDQLNELLRDIIDRALKG